MTVRFSVPQIAEIEASAAKTELSKQQVIRLAVSAGLPVVEKVLGSLGDAGLEELKQLERIAAERKAS